MTERDDNPEFSAADTMTPQSAVPTETIPPDGAHQEVAPDLCATHPSDRLAFPALNGDDAQRMEDLVASRLFPRNRAPVRIGRYTVLDRLGFGGMGVVYAAYDPDLDRRVAIKLILGERLTENAEARLRREAQAMARIVHANVISVIEVGVHGGQTFVVMEHIRGQTLDRWAEREPSPSWRERLSAYVQAGRGLAAAHRGGLIHRDFKPHNAMLVEEGVDAGRVKVLDFGLARPASEADAEGRAWRLQPHLEATPATPSERLTATGALMGTPAYMAPEQIAGEPATEKSDQYAFAVALYEALYGALPYPSTTFAVLARAILDGDIQAPPAASDVPSWVYRAVCRGLARAPEERYPSMASLCDALDRDPSARRRSLSLTVALCTAVGVGGWGLSELAQSETLPCTGPAFELHEVWSPERAEENRSAFTATGLPYAEDTASRATLLVDEYAERWGASRREACQEHRRGESSDNLLDLRIACLDRRRASVGALAELFVSADAELVEHAIEATLRLPPLDLCAESEALLNEHSHPEDPALAAEVEHLTQTLSVVDVVASAGQLDDASRQAGDLFDEAAQLEYPPLVAEVALDRGFIELQRREAALADETLSVALRSSLASGRDRIAAQAILGRIFVRAALLGDTERALADREVAVALSERYPDDGRLQWLRNNNLGILAAIRGELDEARSGFTAATAVSGASPLDRSRTLANLAVLAHDERDTTTSLRRYREAWTLSAEHLGPEHPLVLDQRAKEADALRILGRSAEARELLEELLPRLQGPGMAKHLSVYPQIHLSRLEHHRRRDGRARELAQGARREIDTSDAITLANAEVALARALLGLGEAPAARAHRRLAIESVEGAVGPEHAITATILTLAGSDPAAPWAIEDLQRALRLREAELGPEHVFTAQTQRHLAEAELVAGEPESARARLVIAVTSLRRDADESSQELELGRALLALGRAESALDRVPTALPHLREALVLLQDHLDYDDPDLGAVHLALALTLAKADPETAASQEEPGTHSDAARAIFRGLGDAFDPELDQLAQLREPPAASL